MQWKPLLHCDCNDFPFDGIGQVTQGDMAVGCQVQLLPSCSGCDVASDSNVAGALSCLRMHPARGQAARRDVSFNMSHRGVNKISKIGNYTLHAR